MNTQTQTKNIYQKLAEIKAEIGSFDRDCENKYANYSYTSLGSIYKVLNPKLAKQNLVLNISPSGQSEEGMLFLASLVNTENIEEKLNWSMTFPVAETKGQSIQKLGSTITYAQRYLCSLIFSLAFDDEDPDEGVPAKPLQQPHGEKISMVERDNLMKVMKERGWTIEQLQEHLKSTGFNTIASLTKKRYLEVLKIISTSSYADLVCPDVGTKTDLANY